MLDTWQLALCWTCLVLQPMLPMAMLVAVHRREVPQSESD